MRPTFPPADLVIGITPLQQPDAGLAEAVCRAGALGVLDLGTGDRRAREELAALRERSPGRFGVRVGADCRLTPQDLGAPGHSGVDTVLIDSEATGWDPGRLAADHRVLVEVTDLPAALAAVRAGAHGLVVRGCESGGRVSELSTFVLLQQVLAAPAIDVPVWACGGIGPHTATAAVAGGAAGVVLDSQLALLAESALSDDAAASLRGADGSGTVVVEGRRVLRRGRRDEPSAELTVGQDIFLADQFADRWTTAAAAVRAVRESVLAGLRSVAAEGAPSRLLGPRTPMSRALGTALPVAQGPMTRVSDQPAFAAAVAGAGALPFVALALMDAEDTRDLLARTGAAAGELPWGVGILGFAPEELRTVQLAEVLAARPSHAVIAGGRPAQARALEEAGIRAFLHVPSPGLLRQFLEDGARRFVFEGSECGGHVGPQHSFPLWEAQLAVLEEFLGAADGRWLATTDGQPQVEVLFAGGVHDERSAAMVAAMAAPLAKRGVAAGLLMGTAYLFTREAVALGAVRPRFQRQVLAARATELLQTAPGHATRCVPSPFTGEFLTARERLRADGVPDREAWERLEQLNVGRLRVAAKGVDRGPAGLVEVDEQEQLARGMFMAGQVAVLRSATTTLDELHTAVTAGAAAFLAAGAAEALERLDGEPAGAPEPAPLEIAVIGMAGMFPQAPDLPAFWANVVGGVDAVTEVPVERWDPAVYHAQDGDDATGKTPSKWGGFLPRIPFDPLAYGIPPSALGSIEPVQLLALEAARRALVDAGYDSGVGDGGRAFDRSRASVVFGAEAGSDLSNAGVLGAVLPAYLGRVPEALAEQLPVTTEDSFPGMLANVISGRIANRLDLGGGNFTVDAACASSLAALDVACRELAGGMADLALCGGADLHNGINDYLLFSSVHALSPTGRSRPFDASADGIALGEGVGCVVLKRLADAERDGDRIYAVVQGVGSASDGRSLGLTAPRPEGQRAALERAYRHAGVGPARVGLLEAHGTGTVVGDRTELATLEAVFTEAGAAPGSCALGSVKSQIGHTKCAAGLAGLIKAALALHTGIKPPTLHLRQPNAAWRADGPFVFHGEARPWVQPPAERVAGVSAFGFGGTNFHAVLTGYAGPTPAHGLQEWPAELFLFRGADRARALRGAAELLRSARADGEPWRLRDLALAASRRAEAGHGPVQAAIVASSVADLAALLERAAAGAHAPGDGLHLAGPDGTPGGKVAFLFPGQGSQKPGMFAELFTAFPQVRRQLRLGRPYADVLHPPAAFTPEAREAQRAAVTDTRVAQPVLGMTGLAAHELLALAGVRPDLAGGHSYGELVALCAAGALAVEDLPTLGAERARCILAAVGAGADPGAMAAVTADARSVERVLTDAGLAGRVVAANHNAPRQTVISGPTDDVAAAGALLREAGHGVTGLPVACAFHSPLVAGAGERFAVALAERTVRAPEFPVWSNRTATAYPADPAAVRAELAAQIGAPVRFVDQIEDMYRAGARVFVEAGSGTVLTRLVADVLGDRPHRAVPLERRRAGLAGYLDALAELAVAGVPVRTGRLLRGRDAVEPGRAGRPRRPGWTVDGHLVRTAAGDLLPGALAPARRVPEALMTTPQPGPHHGSADGEALIADFLRSSRELIAAQRDVLMTYLGGGTGTPPAPPVVVAASQPTDLPVEIPDIASDEVMVGGEDEVLRVVVEVIGDRTGYPADMIEPELDLEADLSIDSIKRTEIIGLLARRLGGTAGGLPELDDAQVEELARARTALAIARRLTSRTAAAEPSTATAPSAVPAPSTEAPTGAGHEGHEPVRLRFTTTPLPEPAAPSETLAGRRFALLGDDEHRTADALTARLTALGATVFSRPATHELSEPDGLVDGVLLLDPLRADGPPVLPGSVPVLRAALARAPRWLLAATPGGRDRAAAARGDGLRGLFRSLAREYPDTTVRLVEVDAPARQAPDALLGELTAEDREPVVLRGPAGRRGIALVEAGLGGAVARRGAGPAGDGVAEAAALGLDRDAVVLLVGGARGITARFAAALAAASRCRLELLGRTAAPTGPEDPATAAAHDRAELRSALARQGVPLPLVDDAASRVLAGREVTATLAALSGLGSAACYRTVDAADPAALRQAVKEVHAEHGRLDGVVYAAGVIEDKVFADKDLASFRRVFATKADGAAALLDAIDELPSAPRFTVLFGSIAAALGNRGQSDYAAANDALEQAGARWAERTGNRALTVHWGPWAPTGAHGGMVSPELARDYARRGVRLIDPQAGTLALLRELAWGEPGTRAVVYTASGW